MTHQADDYKLILEKRLIRACGAMRKSNIDVWISTGRETHLLGEPSLIFLTPCLVFTRTALVLTAGGKRIILCAPVEAEELEAAGVYTEVAVYRGRAEFERKLQDILAGCTPANGTIALNTSPLDATSDGLSHSDYLLLSDIMKRIGFTGSIVSSYDIMREVRAHKCAEEVAAIEHAVNCSMDIYDRARPQLKIGMSGKDVQLLFQRLALEAGLGFSWDSRYNPYVSVGPRSSYNCKMPPSDVYIQSGDVVNVDFGVRTRGFASDNQRTFYAAGGESGVPEEVQHAFETLKLINTRVAEAMKVGADSNALGQIGVDTMAECGYSEQIRSYGHEIGIFAHNGGIGAGMNSANDGQNTTLLENMTFTLEPAILTSRGRVCREDVVCVGPQRGRILGRPQEEIWIIEE